MKYSKWKEGRKRNLNQEWDLREVGKVKQDQKMKIKILQKSIAEENENLMKLNEYFQKLGFVKHSQSEFNQIKFKIWQVFNYSPLIYDTIRHADDASLIFCIGYDYCPNGVSLDEAISDMY